MAVIFIGGGNRSARREKTDIDHYDMTEILLKVALNTITLVATHTPLYHIMNFNSQKISKYICFESDNNYSLNNSCSPHYNIVAVMVVIIWYLDLQLPAQSVSITTYIVSSNPVHGEVYSIQHYVIKFVSDLR